MSRQSITPRRRPSSNSHGDSSGGNNKTFTRQTAVHSAVRSDRSSSVRSSGRSSKMRGGISPKKITLGIVIVVVALIAFIAVSDIVGNLGKIHSGVTVQGIDVGGLTTEEAAAFIDQELTAVTGNTPVALFANREALAAGVNESTVEIAPEGSEYDQSDESAASTSWLLNSSNAGLSFDSTALANEAYAIGRGSDFLANRFKASFGGGVNLPASLSFDPAHIGVLESMLTKSIGWEMVNASVEYVDGSFVAKDGRAGNSVDHDAFTTQLGNAFLGTERAFAVPMAMMSLNINYDQALQVAKMVEERVSQSVDLVYGSEEPWTVDSSGIGSWVSVTEEGNGADAKLVPWVDTDKLETGLKAIIGDRDPGIKPIDARFELSGDRIQVVAGTNGTGINYKKVSTDLYDILFGENHSTAKREIALAVTDLEPEFTAEDANAMNIKDKIASYTTEFTVASANKVTNIQLAADLLNNSMIAPGGTWSFHGTAGECNEARGFKKATSIVAGEYVDEIGGGICQVATTVFNAAFDAGLPINERVNHGFYLIAYPAGRDAAVSWQWPDLKFENDTGGHILMTMSYTNSALTCTLWGTDPGYRVEVEDTGFTNRTDFQKKEVVNPDLKAGEKRIKQEGVKGRTIVVTRYVYDKNGQLLRKTDFKSVYAPETEITEISDKPDKDEDKKKEDNKDDEDDKQTKPGQNDDAGTED